MDEGVPHLFFVIFPVRRDATMFPEVLVLKCLLLLPI